MADKLDCPALLGADLGGDLTATLMKHIISQSVSDSLVPVEAEPLPQLEAASLVPERQGH